MEKSEWIVLGLIFVVTIIGFIFFFVKFILKPSFKKMRVSTFFGLKSARIKFKLFDSFLTHSLFVSPKHEYEVVYRMETEEGEIFFNLDDQLKISTTSRKEGSEIIKFSRYKPIIYFKGSKATNGECSIKIHKRNK